MANTIEFEVGQTYALTLGGGRRITIAVKEIDVRNRDIVFCVTGDGVERPNEPRRMDVFALARWIQAHEDRQ